MVKVIIPNQSQVLCSNQRNLLTAFLKFKEFLLSFLVYKAPVNFEDKPLETNKQSIPLAVNKTSVFRGLLLSCSPH